MKVVLEENIRICFFIQDFMKLEIFSNRTNKKQEKKSGFRVVPAAMGKKALSPIKSAK